jgi:hypothetical protein
MVVPCLAAVAAGGVAMTTVAYASVTADGRSFSGQLVLHGPPGNSAVTPDAPLRRLIDAVHAHGAAVSFQLTHAGYEPWSARAHSLLRHSHTVCGSHVCVLVACARVLCVARFFPPEQGFCGPGGVWHASPSTQSRVLSRQRDFFPRDDGTGLRKGAGRVCCCGCVCVGPRRARVFACVCVCVWGGGAFNRVQGACVLLFTVLGAHCACKS